MSKKFWTPAEDTYLRKYYAITTLSEMGRATGRSKHAINARAKLLGLSRTPMNIASTLARDAVIDQLMTGTPMSHAELMAATGIPRTSLSTALKILHDANEIHIYGYRRSGYHALWKLGAGEDAANPSSPAADDPHKLLPIPRPTLGAWGCVWA